MPIYSDPPIVFPTISVSPITLSPSASRPLTIKPPKKTPSTTTAPTTTQTTDIPTSTPLPALTTSIAPETPSVTELPSSASTPTTSIVVSSEAPWTTPVPSIIPATTQPSNSTDVKSPDSSTTTSLSNPTTMVTLISVCVVAVIGIFFLVRHKRRGLQSWKPPATSGISSPIHLDETPQTSNVHMPNNAFMVELPTPRNDIVLTSPSSIATMKRVVVVAEDDSNICQQYVDKVHPPWAHPQPQGTETAARGVSPTSRDFNLRLSNGSDYDDSLRYTDSDISDGNLREDAHASTESDSSSTMSFEL
ncbi:hypothetical protein AeMF1_008974 [Aphanomyces euteiches]|nr:hypothetical protein AeMF1_008974 [Aphanomyces euteiches]KAH9187334.1 hypothetical protein AeNC1_010692 [Aphanomyces euteiches]